MDPTSGWNHLATATPVMACNGAFGDRRAAVAAFDRAESGDGEVFPTIRMEWMAVGRYSVQGF